MHDQWQKSWEEENLIARSGCSEGLNFIYSALLWGDKEFIIYCQCDKKLLFNLFYI